MTKHKTISFEEMDSIFIFNEDGTLTRKSGRKCKVGHVTNKGYLKINVNGELFLAHRLVYAYHTGEWPDRIDRIDQNKLNNRITNLRPISNSDNMANNNNCWNSCGYRGIHRHNDGYRAEVVKLGKRYKSKVYSSPKEAHEEYLRMREQVYPDLIVGGCATEERL